MTHYPIPNRVRTPKPIKVFHREVPQPLIAGKWTHLRCDGHFIEAWGENHSYVCWSMADPACRPAARSMGGQIWKRHQAAYRELRRSARPFYALRLSALWLLGRRRPMA